MPRLRRRAAGQRGQTSTEYMMVISVLVIAIIGAVYLPMRRAAQQGTQGFQNKMRPAAQQGVFSTNANDER